MATQLILDKFQTKTAFTITATALTAGSARQSDMIVNTSFHKRAMLWVALQTGGTAPTAGTVFEIYLLQGNAASSPTLRTDNAGATDAAITIVNASLIDVLAVTNNSSTLFRRAFPTPADVPLGYEWGIAVRNGTNQTSGSTGLILEYSYFDDEIQAAA